MICIVESSRSNNQLPMFSIWAEIMTSHALYECVMSLPRFWCRSNWLAWVGTEFTGLIASWLSLQTHRQTDRLVDFSIVRSQVTYCRRGNCYCTPFRSYKWYKSYQCTVLYFRDNSEIAKSITLGYRPGNYPKIAHLQYRDCGRRQGVSSLGYHATTNALIGRFEKWSI